MGRRITRTDVMRVFFSVGEPSGDLHASNLIRELKRRDPQISCVGFGGPKMQTAGCELLADLTGLAVMFLDQVFSKIGTFLGYLKQAENYLANHAVDAVVLIDYPGFNWWIARAAKRHNIPVYYYGVPQMWAWAPWRIGKLKRLVDHVLCKLPFESAWFGKRGVAAKYVGHPYFDQLHQQQYDESLIAELKSFNRPTLLLLPGSRNGEMKTHWPILRQAARICAAAVPDLQIVVGCYRESFRQQIESDELAKDLPLRAFVGCTPELMRAANACIACSGSVSLELMFHQLPTVIVYQLTKMRMWASRRFLRCRYITLVNLMATSDIERGNLPIYDPDSETAEQVPMPEYLCNSDRSAAIACRAIRWLTNPESAEANRRWLGDLKQKFALPGATSRAADVISVGLSQSRQRAA